MNKEKYIILFLLSQINFIKCFIDLNIYSENKIHSKNYLSNKDLSEGRTSITVYQEKYNKSLNDDKNSNIEKIIENIIQYLGNMSEIKITISNEKDIRTAINQSMKNKISLFLYIKHEDNIIIFKLYDSIKKQFIIGKKYIIKGSQKDKIERRILHDIWQVLFEEEQNPFNSFLIFLNNNNIVTTHPFTDKTQKILFSSKYHIIDLATIPSQPKNSIVFIQAKNNYMYLKKINSHGQIITLYRTKKTLSSPSANHDGLFFIENEKLKFYSFNHFTKQYSISTLDSNQDYASIYSILNEHTILAARNNNIYKINYDIDSENKKITTINGIKINEKNIKSGNITYSTYANQIITSQKINQYYQLVLYDGINKIILTDSPFHKQDPSISPCQNYIAYVAQNDLGERYIEIINILTREITRVTKEAGLYRFVNWIIK